MISGGITGSSSQDHRPDKASQILVKTRVAVTPPWLVIQSAARFMCAASGSSPASLSATYASTVVDRSPGRPEKLAQVPSSRCCERIQTAVSSASVLVRMPRKCRSRTSSASIVTLVSSSPIHQPRGSCRPSRWSRARVSVAAATWPRSAPADDEISEMTDSPGESVISRWALRSAPSASVPRVGALRLAVVTRSSLLASGPLPLPRGDEFCDGEELGPDIRGDADAVEGRGGGLQPVVGFLFRPGLAAGGDDQVGGAHQVVLGQLVLAGEQRLQLGGLGGTAGQRGHDRERLLSRAQVGADRFAGHL